MMNRIIGVVLLTAGSLACTPAVEDAAVSNEADLQAVRDVRAQEVAAINAGDTTFAHASADIVMMPPGEYHAGGLEGDSHLSPSSRRVVEDHARRLELRRAASDGAVGGVRASTRGRWSR